MNQFTKKRNMIKVGNVIAFVEEGMKRGLCVYINPNSIDVEKDRDNYAQFYLNEYDESLLVIFNSCGKCKIENLTDAEILSFKLLMEKVKAYSEIKCVEAFNAFYKEDENKEVTIDDLDDKEE